MTYEELIQSIKEGTLPPVGITRRSGKAIKVKITTEHKGEIIDVPDVSIDQESAGDAKNAQSEQ